MACVLRESACASAGSERNSHTATPSERGNVRAASG